mgnify:CR=1 FL=1
MAIREHKMNFWQHKNNDANRGFFPTPLEVVKMEMDLIDFSEIEKDGELTICDLTGGDGEQLKEMYDYLIKKELNPMAYYNEVTKERYNIALDKFKDIGSFNLINADFFNLKVRNTNSKKAFTIIRNNPPYTWMDWKGVNIRAEDIFFTRNAELNVDGGIQIFELPIHQLIEQKALIRKIFFRYGNVHIFKFPEEEFEKFKQVCVIGIKKKNNSNDNELAETWREKLKHNMVQSLDEIRKPVITLSQSAINKTLPILLYRDGKVTDETLTGGFNAVYDELLTEAINSNQFKELNKDTKIPIIEQLPGHIALDIYSGMYDGLIGNVLVKGGVNKSVKVITEMEGDKKVTTEIETVHPFVEITSANGKSFVKEHKEDD